MSIGLKYDPREGLVQIQGSSGLSLGNSPITYSHAKESVNSVSSDYSVGNESFIIVDAGSGDVTITLPSIVAGRVVAIKKIDPSSNTVTVETAESETIDGGSNVIITTQWTSITFQAISGNWFIK